MKYIKTIQKNHFFVIWLTLRTHTSQLDVLLQTSTYTQVACLEVHIPRWPA